MDLKGKRLLVTGGTNFADDIFEFTRAKGIVVVTTGTTHNRIMATGLEKSGGGELLANWFIGLFGADASPFVLYAAFLILVVVLTQFLSNSTVLAIILPVVFSITGGLGLNTFSFAVGLTIAGAMAVATPLANTTIGMSMVAKYRFSDYFKYAGPFTALALLVLLVLVPILWPLA